MSREEKVLKSIESTVRSFLKFKNVSLRTVDLYWLNFKGERVHFKQMPPDTDVIINTFVTHPWIFVCSRTGEQLHVNNSEVYMPEPWFKYINNVQDGVVGVSRQDIFIHFPLRSLRDNCLWELVFLVETKDEIYDLEIPHSLKVDLLKNFRSSNRYNQEEGERNRPDRFIM